MPKSTEVLKDYSLVQLLGWHSHYTTTTEREKNSLIQLGWSNTWFQLLEWEKWHCSSTQEEQSCGSKILAKCYSYTSI